MAQSVLELLKIAQECGEPELVSLYDEEAVEGWVWTHPDGRTWTETGTFCAPEHPLLAEVDRDDIAEAVHDWLESNHFLTEEIIGEQAALMVMSKEDLVTKYSGIEE